MLHLGTSSLVDTSSAFCNLALTHRPVLTCLHVLSMTGKLHAFILELSLWSGIHPCWGEVNCMPDCMPAFWNSCVDWHIFCMPNSGILDFGI